MDKIRITSQDGLKTIEMPRVKDVSVGATEVANKVTMASGKVVKDIIGYRATISASWDWVPADTIKALAVLLRGGGFFRVDYPAPSGDAFGIFEIQYPTMTVFGFKNGVAVWHDVKLSMTAQGVTR